MGLLYATGRRYLVGRSRHHGEVHLFRLGRIESVQLTDDSFYSLRGFNIEDYARKSFGMFQERPVEVVWRFRPEAAADARTFLFHPTQKFRSLRDGSVIVAFRAGGLLEMCWHLFTWGDAVEILKPKKLQAMYRALLANAAKVEHGMIGST